MDTSTKADIGTQISFWTTSSFDSTLRFPWQQPPLALPPRQQTNPAGLGAVITQGTSWTPAADVTQQGRQSAQTKAK